MKLSHLIILSFIFSLIGFWKRNDFTANAFTLDALKTEPIQEKIRRKKFTVGVNSVDYEINPLYNYELYGVIVSYRIHDGNTRLHKLWNDHLNVADYCIVWGETALAATLSKIKFWNGQFTCNISTRNQEAWENFDIKQLSNNHLITDDKFLRKKISKMRIGDQIRIEGNLAEYTNLNTKSTRGTSITRNDTGNGACETLYVTDVEILKSYTSQWRILMYVSMFICAMLLIVYFRKPIQFKD